MKYFVSYYDKSDGTTYSPVLSSLARARAWVSDNAETIAKEGVPSHGIDVWSSNSPLGTTDQFEGVYTLVEHLRVPLNAIVNANGIKSIKETTLGKEKNDIVTE